MASVSSPTLTQTITECYVFGTTSGLVYATPAAAIASGAQCYEIYPTNGGLEVQLIPTSDAWPMSTEPAATPTATESSPPVVTSSASTPTNSHQIVGAVVGGVVGILVLSIPVLWYFLRRERQKKRLAEQRQWAMVPGKWASGNNDTGRGESRTSQLESAIPNRELQHTLPQEIPGNRIHTSGHNGSEITLPVSEYAGENKLEEVQLEESKREADDARFQRV